MAMGLSAVGRPSNRTGAALLRQLLSGFSEERSILVLGENDQKENGLWPGRDGAMYVAQELARTLERVIYWALPPDGAKDGRDWVRRFQGIEPESLRELWLQGLELTRVPPPPVIRAESSLAPVVSVDGYRERMLAARLASLDRPAIYLDRSPTGSGKSYQDVLVLRHLLGLETAIP